MHRSSYRPSPVTMPALWSEGPVLFTGNANPALASDVAAHLGIPLGKAIVGRFSDGEVNVEILENVRNKEFAS